MTATFAINGFGRIGRLVFRAWLESGRNDCEITAINDLAPLETNAHLLKYDSVHGRLPYDVDTQGNDILIANGKKVKVYNQRNLEDIPKTDEGVDVVLECTGIFTIIYVNKINRRDASVVSRDMVINDTSCYVGIVYWIT